MLLSAGLRQRLEIHNIILPQATYGPHRHLSPQGARVRPDVSQALTSGSIRVPSRPEYRVQTERTLKPIALPLNQALTRN